MSTTLQPLQSLRHDAHNLGNLLTPRQVDGRDRSLVLKHNKDWGQAEELLVCLRCLCVLRTQKRRRQKCARESPSPSYLFRLIKPNSHSALCAKEVHRTKDERALIKRRANGRREYNKATQNEPRGTDMPSYRRESYATSLISCRCSVIAQLTLIKRHKNVEEHDEPEEKDNCYKTQRLSICLVVLRRLRAEMSANTCDHTKRGVLSLFKTTESHLALQLAKRESNCKPQTVRASFPIAFCVKVIH